MELIYLKYQPEGKEPRYLLLLYLGDRNGKICGILTDVFSDQNRDLVLKNAKRLAGLSLERSIEWFKVNMPTALSSGYREIKKSNANEVSRHPIGRI